MDQIVTIADAEQWQRVRDMRIKGLASDPEAYGANAETESGYDEQHWLDCIARDRWILVSVDGSDIAIAAVSDHFPEVVQSQCEDPRGAWVYGCWVDPQWRGRGIAGILLAQGERLALEWGLPQVGLGVFTTNASARRAYERLGLRAVGGPLQSLRRADAQFQPMLRAVATSRPH